MNEYRSGLLHFLIAWFRYYCWYSHLAVALQAVQFKFNDIIRYYILFSVGLVYWQVISQSQSIELSGPPYRTTLEPNLPPPLRHDSCFSHQIPLPPHLLPAIFIWESAVMMKHTVLMLTSTLPRALFTASVTYHQIKAASQGWKYEPGP